MSVSSASTDAEVKAAIDDNADYDLGAGDVTKAREFVHACRIRLNRMLDEVEEGGSNRIAQSYKRIESLCAKAEAWLSAQDTSASTADGGAVRYRHFTYLRD